MNRLVINRVAGGRLAERIWSALACSIILQALRFSAARRASRNLLAAKTGMADA